MEVVEIQAEDDILAQWDIIIAVADPKDARAKGASGFIYEARLALA